ncbi:MAG: hypothetical protein ACRERU_00110 [Methylococcales bacterium]
MSESNGNGRSRWILCLLVVLCAGPFVIALVLYSNGSGLISSNHYGTLIRPAIPVSRSELVGFDSFSTENLSEVPGRWILLHFVTHHGCGLVCRKSLEKTRQVRLMLGKDLMRVRRVVMVMAEISAADANPWWAEHPDLLRIFSTRELEGVAVSAMGSPIRDGSLMILDPIGKFMMWYPADFDPYGLKKDLQRLLLVSQIG